MENKQWLKLFGYMVLAALASAILERVWNAFFDAFATPTGGTEEDWVRWMAWAQYYVTVGLGVGLILSFLWLWRASIRRASDWRTISRFRWEWWLWLFAVCVANIGICIWAFVSEPEIGSHSLVYIALLVNGLTVYLCISNFATPSPYKYVPLPRGAGIDKELIERAVA